MTDNTQWNCARCGQLNAGWASECGRCHFSYAASRAAISTTTGVDDLIARLIQAHEAAGFGSIHSSLLYAAAAALREQRDEIGRLDRTLSDHLESESAETMRADRAEAEQDHWKRGYDDLYQFCNGVKAERDAAMKDAERYRWLRNGDSAVEQVSAALLTIPHLEQLDAAIDAALSKEKP